MAVDKLVDSTQLDADLTSVANAIRTKGGTSSQLAFPAGFVSAVQAIPTGVTPTGTKNISITANGVTTEDVTNYASAQITANVPNTYAAADEGKVVSNGALVAQGSDTVTQNDTYDTTLISSLTVNVSGGEEYLFDMNHLAGQTAKWEIPLDFNNTLSSGGYFEVKFNFTGVTPTTGAMVVTFGGKGNMTVYNANNVIHLFAAADGPNTLVIRHSAVSTNINNVDFSVPHTVKVDKDNIYFDGTAVASTNANLVNADPVRIASSQGNNRFNGTYDYIRYK